MAAQEILLLGDLILDVPEPDNWLAGIAPLTRAADLVIGHLEVPYTTSEEEMPIESARLSENTFTNPRVFSLSRTLLYWDSLLTMSDFIYTPSPAVILINKTHIMRTL